MGLAMVPRFSYWVREQSVSITRVGLTFDADAGHSVVASSPTSLAGNQSSQPFSTAILVCPVVEVWQLGSVADVLHVAAGLYTSLGQPDNVCQAKTLLEPPKS